MSILKEKLIIQEIKAIVKNKDYRAQDEIEALNKIEAIIDSYPDPDTKKTGSNNPEDVAPVYDAFATGGIITESIKVDLKRNISYIYNDENNIH